MASSIAPVAPTSSPPLRRGIRYEGLLSPQRLQESSVLVVGCGAIGRRVAMAWAEMGIGTLVLFDDDTVNTENLGTQGWRPSQLGVFKTTALADDLASVNPECHVVDCRFRKTSLAKAQATIVHLCVDTMECRRVLVESIGSTPEEARGWWEAPGGPRIVVDSRMGALYSRTAAIWDEESRASYLSELYTDSEVEVPMCTLRATGFMAGVGANIAVGTAALWLGRGLPPMPRDIGVGADGWRTANLSGGH